MPSLSGQKGGSAEGQFRCLLFCPEYCRNGPMKTTPAEYAGIYQGMALIADPIYRYASFTVPTADGGEKT